MSFWVVGGIYKDTKFKELAEGQKLEKYGKDFISIINKIILQKKIIISLFY